MKKNALTRLMALVLCLCLLLGMAAFSVSAATGSYHDMSLAQILDLDEDLTWVFTGDSITHNGGWTGGYNDYAAWFEQYLYDIGRGDDTLINSAWGGAAIDHFLPTRDGADGMGLEQFVTKYNPDVVFIKLGMNNRTMANATFIEKYNAMLDGIYAAGAKNGKVPKVILLSPTPLSGESGISSGEFGSDPTNQQYYDSVHRFSINIGSIAKERGLQFVDLRQAMVDESAVLGDRYHHTFFSDPSDGLIHPNGAGQYFMFKTICKTLGLYDSDMPIFKVSYDDIINAPLYGDHTAISYTGSYSTGTVDTTGQEMDKTMPLLEQYTGPELLAWVDFTSQNGSFVGGATYAGATRVDLTDAAVMGDALTLGEVQSLEREYSLVLRARLDPSNRDNQPVLWLSNTNAAWNDSLALGVQGKGDQIYYNVLKGSTTHLNVTSGTLAIDATKAASNGQWHTIAYVQTTTGLQYYVDGVLVNTVDRYVKEGAAIGDIFANTTNLTAHIGSYGTHAGTYQLDGDLDYYQLYKGALSAEAIAQLSVQDASEAQMDKTMPTLTDVSPLAAVDFTSATGVFSGSGSYASATRVDLTNEAVMDDALTLEEVQGMGREFTIVVRGNLDSTTFRPHQALLMMSPDANDEQWDNALSVGGPGTGNNIYYEVRQAGKEMTNSSNTIALTTNKLTDTWHTLAIVQKTDGLDLYVDGVLAQSTAYKLNDGLTIGDLFAETTTLTAQLGAFAQNDAGTYTLKGNLDYYQLYGTALTAQQLQTLGTHTGSTTAQQMDATMPKLTGMEKVPQLLASVDFTKDNGKLDFGSSEGLRIDTAAEGYEMDPLTQAEAASLGSAFSLVVRTQLNCNYQSNQPALFISSNGTANWQKALVLGLPATGNQLYFNFNAGTAVKKTGTIPFSGTTVNGDGQFHTLVVTYDAGTITYYVDGTQAGQVTGYGLKDGVSSIGSLFAESTNFAAQIGRYGTEADGTSYKLKGDFDFWQLYDGALTTGQIQTLSEGPQDTVVAAAWTDTVKANSLWAVVGADQMSGYLGQTPNFSLFRLLNNGMRGGANAGGSFRDIRMMNLAKPGQTVSQVVSGYDAILGEHQSIYDVLMILPELPEVHAAGYSHSADKVAAYKADLKTILAKNAGKAIVLWSPLASPNTTLNGYISDYAAAVREIVGEDPTVLFFDANAFMNERMATVGTNWFDDSMHITPLCATDLAYGFYVNANYPTYDNGKDPTNKGELKNHNLRYGTDKRLYKSGVIKENLSYGVTVSGGSFTVDVTDLAAKGYTDLRVAVLPDLGIGSVVEPWILGSAGQSLEAPHSNPVITVYGEKGGYTYRFQDVKLSLSTDKNLTEPYTYTDDLTGLKVVGAPAIGFTPDKTAYEVELYQYQRQVRLVAEGGNNLTIRVDGKTVGAGQFSQYIEVTDTKTVTVTVSGGAAEKTYTLKLKKPAYPDIIITEVMTDGYDGYTKSGADNYELIEIYNASGEDLNLLDYSIGYLREYPYANDMVESGEIPFYFTGNDHNFFGNSFLGINQITKYSSYWADKADQEPEEVLFPADSTMVIWVKFSKTSGTEYGAALTYDTLIEALRAHSGTHTLTVEVEADGQTVTKTIVPNQEQLVVAEIPYGAAQSNVTQNITTTATNFYMDNFTTQVDYNNRRGWLFVLQDSAVRSDFGALTEAGDDIISAAKYVRPGTTQKLSSVMYYNTTRGLSAVLNPGSWDTEFSTGHTSQQQGYANLTSFGAIEYWQKPYDFADTTAPQAQAQVLGAQVGTATQIRLAITDDQDIRFVELYVDLDGDGTYETTVRKDITLITSAVHGGKALDVQAYTLTYDIAQLDHTVSYYGYVLDGNNNKLELGSAEAPLTLRAMEEAPSEPKYESASVTLENALSVNFKVDAFNAKVMGYTDLTTVFHINGMSFTSTAVEKDEQLIFTLKSIQPDWMGETITAELYGTKDGEEVLLETREYSIAQYCMNLLGSYEGEKQAQLRTLLVDLLNYGAAAQAYTGYKTDTPVNAALTEEQKSWGSQGEVEAKSVLALSPMEAPKASWVGVALYLRDTTRIRVHFTSDEADITVHVTNAEGGKWVLTQEDFQVSGNHYYVFFDHIATQQMRTAYDFTVYAGDTQISPTLTYSVESYAANATGEVKTLTDAMLRYGDSAIAFIK